MKIVCMIRSLQLGGAERQLLALADVLHRAGHEVCVLTYRKGDFYRDTLDRLGLEHVLLEKKTHLWSWAGDMSARLRQIGCDVLIAYLPGACLKAMLVHRMDPFFRLVVSERNFSRHLGLPDRFRLWCAWREADRVVSNNHAQEALIRKDFPLLSGKISTISNFVDIDYFSPADGLAGTAPDASGDDCRRIVVTARVCRRKNTLGLIEAAALLKGRGYRFRIDWWGLDREDSYYNKILAAIARLGLRDVFFVRPATKQVRQAYRAADVFCLPSFYEGTSNALAEALACGKPVVCSAVSDNPRYVRDGVNGFLFDPSDPVSIADALEQVLRVENETLTRMGRASRETALTQLHPDRFARAYQGLIDSLR